MLELLDPMTIAIDMPAVARAAKTFGFGDPTSEEALHETRAVLADDLHAKPEVSSVLGRLTIRGRYATWTVRDDGLVILAMKPTGVPRPQLSDPLTAPSDGTIEIADRTRDTVRATGGGVPDALPITGEQSHPAPPSASTAVDLVSQIERLAALKERGLLTDDEFAAAKAKILG